MDTTWLARLPHRTFADINAGSLKLEQIETPVRKGVDVHGECNGTCRTVELPIPDNAMQMTLFHLVQDQEARVRASTATGYYCVLLRQQQQEQYNSFHAVGRRQFTFNSVSNTRCTTTHPVYACFMSRPSQHPRQARS